MSGLVVDLLFQGKLVRTVSFDRPVLRIGRMRENDIVVDNVAVSRFHARLQLEAGRVFLEDGGSENGSWVNDQRVRGRVEVAPGDRIVIGKHQLRVRSRHIGEPSLDDAPTTPPESLQHGDLRSDPWDARETYLAGPETRAKLQQAGAAPPLALREPIVDGSSIEDSIAAMPGESEELEPMSDAGFTDALDRDALDFASGKLARPGEVEEFAALEERAELSVPAELADLEPAGDGEEGDVPAATVLLGEEDVDEALAPAAATSLHAGLIVQREGKIERVVPWEGDAFTVGRSAECDLVLGQDEVSRRHARFVRHGDRYEVHDLGSVNGTLVNGKRAERHDLAVGDVIAIESFQLTFVLDREPITGAMKPAPPKPTVPMLDGARDTFAMTILQEVMPAGALDAPARRNEATIANITLEEDPLEAPDVLDEPFAEPSIDERKELATAQPRGSSRAASVQDLGPAAAPSPTITIELRLRTDQLPEPLRRALEEAGTAELVIPADLRLRSA
ncbi:MAG: FHA domain-containing protein [Deltaproteobacteria bacterium]|nr:FHA domain-containing protein [Deltaproteobacteria bacterium]